VSGIVFPVGTVLFVCAATANRDPMTYADPGIHTMGSLPVRFTPRDAGADRRGRFTPPATTADG